MSKFERDIERWAFDPPMVLPGWVRVSVDKPVHAGDAWSLLPEDVSDEVDRPVLMEWRPSSVMGWGLAAVWYGPKETDTDSTNAYKSARSSAAAELELIDDAFCDIWTDQRKHIGPEVQRTLMKAIDRLRAWRERNGWMV